MKRLAVFLILLSTFFLLRAQTSETAKKEKISQIKQAEEQYIYADETCATVNQALTQAKKALEKEASAYLAQQNGGYVSDEEVSDVLAGNIEQITLSRGDKYRAFVFVSKEYFPGGGRESESNQTRQSTSPMSVDQIQPVSVISVDASPIEVVTSVYPQQESLTSSKTAELTPVVEEVVEDEAHEEAIAAEEGSLEEAEEVAIEETEGAIEAAVEAYEEAVEEAYEEVAVVVEEVVEESVPEEVIYEEVVSEPGAPEISYSDYDFWAIITSFKSKLKLYDYIQQLKKDGVSITYVSHLMPNDTEHYLVLYKRDGSIEAILSPGDDVRVNMATGKADSIRNHPSCGIDGFMMK